MVQLNTADAVYLGSTKADAVYLGATKVWTAATPFSFGNPATRGSGTANGGYLWVDTSTSSPRTGTITSVTFYTETAAALTMYTGSLSGSTFTIRGHADVTSDGSGTQTAAVSLPVSQGDCLGVWSSASLARMLGDGTGSSVSASGSKPTAGSYGLSGSLGDLCITMTGS